MGETKQNTTPLPRGISVRKNNNGSTIYLTFTYKGILCREPLSGVDATSKNLRYAERLLGEIKNKISFSQFVYGDYFPKSKKNKILGTTDKGKTILEYLNEYLIICENRKLSPSSIVGYKKCRSALKSLHKLPAIELTPALLKTWITDQHTTLKTIRNQLSFLRSAMDEAVTDGLVQHNPANNVKAARYKNVSNSEEDPEYVVDPLSPDEIDALLVSAGNVQWEHLFAFALETGMRSSELCALNWEHVDFIGKTVAVRAARVAGVTKGTKTAAGKRRIELTARAVEILLRQKTFTFMKNGAVFEDPKTGQPWAGADAIRKKAWVPTLRKAGIRYRNPYQTRHTFATRHISRGANLFWLADQMGHKGPEMLFRHYGSYLEAYDGNTGRKDDAGTSVCT